jgi:tetratricopeptide (TPR) repeat protein
MVENVQVSSKMYVAYFKLRTLERANLLASIAIAEMGLGRWEAAHANLRKALEIHIQMGDREMMGASFSELAQALISAGRFDEAAEIAQRGLTHLQGDISAYRVHLFAALAEARAMGPDHHLAEESWRAALELSAKLSDRKVMGRALGARSVAYFQLFRLREAAEDGLRSEQLGGMETAPWPGALQRLILIGALLYLGRLDEAARIADALEPLSRKIGQSHWVAVCSFTRTWMELGAAPQLAKFDNVLQQLAALARWARSAFWDALLDIQFSLLNYFRGDWTSALQHAKAACRHDSGISMEGFGAGILFRHLAYAGERPEAFAFLNQTRRLLPTAGQHNPRGSWLLLASVVEGLLMLGEEGLAAQLYPLTLELIDTGAVALWPIWRLTQTAAGIAASAAHQYEAAEEHFRTAMRHAESLPHLLEQAEINRFHAMMLLDRAAPGDREKAQTLLREALETYTQIGMPRHIEMTQTLLARAAGLQE